MRKGSRWSAATPPRATNCRWASRSGANSKPTQNCCALGGVAPGDRLILTKALGTGVLWNADMRGLAASAWIDAAIASMLRSNANAARVARAFGATACTDVSGFGFAGHLGSMLRASGVSARIALDALPLLPGASACFARGLRSTFHAENEKARRALRIAADAASRPELAALFDPQTSGGLLIAIPADRADAALAELHASGDPAAACVGEATDPAEHLFAVEFEPSPRRRASG